MKAEKSTQLDATVHEGLRTPCARVVGVVASQKTREFENQQEVKETHRKSRNTLFVRICTERTEINQKTKTQKCIFPYSNVYLNILEIKMAI